MGTPTGTNRMTLFALETQVEHSYGLHRLLEIRSRIEAMQIPENKDCNTRMNCENGRAMNTVSLHIDPTRLPRVITSIYVQHGNLEEFEVLVEGTIQPASSSDPDDCDEIDILSATANQNVRTVHPSTGRFEGVGIPKGEPVRLTDDEKRQAKEALREAYYAK